MPPQPGSYTLINVTKTRIELKQKIEFEFNKGTIKAVSLPLLDEVVAALGSAPRIRIEIQGHTDSTGNDDANLRLSQARAEAVLAYLVGRGIDVGRLAARGFGETMPIADNRTDDGRAQNRRVELVIVEGAK